MVASIPEGMASITPYLVLQNAADAMKLYEKALGAKEVYKMLCPNSGMVMHACMQIGSSKIFLSDANPSQGCMAPTTSSFYLYVNDVDATFRQAKQAGMQETSAVDDQFWGDRTGGMKDGFGNSWTLATHVRDVSPQEMDEARKKMAAKNKAA